MKKLLRLLTLLLALLGPNAHALLFWDANGNSPGAGGPTPTGTWGVDPYWSTNGTGGIDNNGSEPWASGLSAVFAAGDDATGAYTVNVTPNLQVADIHVDLGNVTFEGGPIVLKVWNGDTTNRLLSVGQKDQILGISSVARYNTVLTGAYGIIRYKRGTLIFGATNTYTGPTTIEGGILQLGAPNVIPTNSDLILSNNGTNRDDVGPGSTPGGLVLDGHSQMLGQLILTGPDPSTPRVIDFGGGAADLTFIDSHTNSWTDDNGAPLDLFLVNYKPGLDTLRFGDSANGLTPEQLAQIHFITQASLPGKIDASGFVTPVLPVMVSARRTTPGQTDLTWSSVPGHNYRMQYKDDLRAASWTDVVPDVSASDVATTASDTSASATNRFYRIIALP